MTMETSIFGQLRPIDLDQEASTTHGQEKVPKIADFQARCRGCPK